MDNLWIKTGAGFQQDRQLWAEWHHRVLTIYELKPVDFSKIAIVSWVAPCVKVTITKQWMNEYIDKNGISATPAVWS